MAAPSPTARQTPSGFKMPDGFKTFFTLANKPDIQMWEMSVKPPGLDIGEPIPTTTMHNVRWRTFAMRKLLSIPPSSFSAMFDPQVWTDLVAQIGVEQAITITHPDYSDTALWGALQKVDMSDQKEGEPPMISGVLVFTNWDPVNKVEAGPAFAGSPGT